MCNNMVNDKKEGAQKSRTTYNAWNSVKLTQATSHSCMQF